MKVKEALSNSWGILIREPNFFLPMIIVTGLSSAVLWLRRGPFENFLLIFILQMIGIIVSVLVYGMYPSMVRDYLEKEEIDFIDSLHFSYHKFWSLIGALIPAGIVLFAVITPISLLLSIAEMLFHISILSTSIRIIVGILILAFFYYLFAAIIMDDLKAFSGFERSIKVAKDNYLFTLLILLVPAVILLVVAIPSIVYALGMPADLRMANHIPILLLVLYFIIALFIETWASIIACYAYYNLSKSGQPFKNFA